MEPTLVDKLLAVARQLSQPFGVEELVVAAWQTYPAEFGLAGWRDTLPDSNKVITKLYGRKGMVSGGLLRKMGPKRFKVVARNGVES